jgi:hypothetical protein
VPPVPPTYRERLRLEGWWLVACGAAGSAILLATTEESRRWPLNTAAQCAAAGGIAVALGRRGTGKAMADADEVDDESELGGGEPTPLWMHPLIVAGLALFFRGLKEIDAPGADAAGWDASLRITIGSALVGLTQAIVLERQVAAEEQSAGRTYYRYKGSRGMRTVLRALRRSPTASERT